MTDSEILALCEKYGSEAREARRRFEGLLPEVNRRQLYLQKNCSSIYMFAGILAGMSRDQVDIVLRLETRFQDKPVLKEALVQGIISVNKLARIVSVATVENQYELLEKVRNLSNRALEIQVKDIKFERQNDILKKTGEQISLHVQTLKLAEDVEQKLIEMQEKGLDINEILRDLLRSRKERIEAERACLSDQQKRERDEKAMIGVPVSRYIPMKIRKILVEEFGTKCSQAGCNKMAKQIHHEKYFATSQMHDPNNLKPLCDGHHEIRHVDDFVFRKYRRNL